MRLTRNLSGAAGALLVAFHGWLFAGQFLGGQLAQPYLVLRWVVAAVLVATLVTIRRRGDSLFSRNSVAVWVLAALLHGPAVAGHYGEASRHAALPQAAASAVLQIAAASTALVFALWLLGALLDRRPDRLARFADVALGHRLSGVFACRFSPPFSPRPPPVS